MYESRYKERLLNEPLVVDIGDEKFRLLPRNRNEKKPYQIKQATSRIVDLLKEKADWEIMPGLLKELGFADRPPRESTFVRMVQRASEMGMLGVVMKCIDMAEKTRFVLKSPWLVGELMWMGIERAMQDGWSEEATLAGVQFAKRIASTLDDPLHCGGPNPPSDDPRVHPNLLGPLLVLSAAQAVKHFGGQDRERLVERYSMRLMSSWGRDKIQVPEYPGPLKILEEHSDSSSESSSLQSEPSHSSGGTARRRIQWTAYKAVMRWTPSLIGMELAAKVDLAEKLPEITGWLQETIPPLRRDVERCVEIVNDETRLERKIGSPRYQRLRDFVDSC